MFSSIALYDAASKVSSWEELIAMTVLAALMIIVLEVWG